LIRRAFPSGQTWSALLAILAALLLSIATKGESKRPASSGTSAQSSTFYKDILPVLRDHCQACHREGEIAPMPLMTYTQTQPWAMAIKQAVQSKQIAPWFQRSVA